MAPNTQTDQQQEQKPVVLDNEPMPQFDDDGERGTPRSSAPPPVDDDDGGDDAPPMRRGDAVREAIAKRAREIRDQERAKDDEMPPIGGDPLPGQELAAEAAEPAAAPPPPVADDEELELIVYGNVFKRKRSELVAEYKLEGFDDAHIIRIAQKHLAADQQLREAKEAVNQRLAGSQDRGAGAGDAGQVPPIDQSDEPRPNDANELRSNQPPQGQDQPFNEDNLDEIVQRVQFGDADEAKAALRDFALEIKKSIPAATSDQVLAEFEQRLATRQHQTEIHNALTKFRDDNPDLVKDQHLVTVGLDIAKEEMLNDLRAVPGMKEEYLAPIAHDRRAVATAHRTVQLQGHQVRSLDQILTAAGDTMRSKFHLPRPEGANPGSQASSNSEPSPARERMSRKEFVQQQPRHGGARAAPPPTGDRPKSTLDIINEQRRARGFHSV